MSYNFAAWSYKQFNEYVRATQIGDFMKSNELLALVHTYYNTADDLHDLDLVTAAEVKREAAEALEEEIKRLDISKVRVDFKAAGWTDRIMNNFRKAQQSGDIDTVEKMLLDVASITDNDFTGGSLSFHQGVVMSRAVTEAYRKILSGE